MTAEQFEKDANTLYRVIAIYTSVPMRKNHVEFECETLERAVEIADEFSGLYRHVYIRKETELTYYFD